MRRANKPADPDDFSLAVSVKDPDEKGRALTAGCVLRGTVNLSAPSTASAGGGACVWRVNTLRIQLQGVEQHGISKDGVREGAASPRTSSDIEAPTVHLWRTLTLVGVPGPAELEDERAQWTREQLFVQANTRGAPLTGVVLSVHGPSQEGGSSGAAPATTTAGDGGRGSGGARTGSAGDVDTVVVVGYEQSLPKRTMLLRPGAAGAVNFAVKLPPWLPPSLYYHIDTAAHGFIRYTVTAILDADLVAGDSNDDTGVLLAPSRRHGEWQTKERPFVLRSALPRRQLLQCHERAGLKPIFTQTWRFRVRSQNVLTQVLNAGKVTVGAVEVTVKYLSSTALLLTDPDEPSSVALRDRWTMALAGANGGGGSGGGGVSSPITTTAGGLPPPATTGVDATGATVLGTVVSSTSAYTSRPSAHAGNSGSGGHGTASASATASPPPPPPLVRAPIGELRLRVRIANGSRNDTEKTLKKMPDVTCVRVELMEQVLLHRSPPGPKVGRPSQHEDSNILYTSEPIRLGYQDCRQKVRPGESQNFEVVITLPPRFRRSRLIQSWKVSGGKGGRGRGGPTDTSSSSDSVSDDDATSSPMERAGSPGYSYGNTRHPAPPPSLTTQHFTSLTYLRVTLPSHQVIPETEPDTRNIIVLAEAVDETDTVPYLPLVVSP